MRLNLKKEESETKTVRQIASVSILLGLLVSGQEGSALAATSTWTSAVSGNWSESAKWDTPPTSASDTVIRFTQAGTYTVNNDLPASPFILKQIICENSSGAISLSGNNISFQGADAGVWVTSASASLIVSSMPIVLATNITVSGTVTMTSTDPITGSGSMIITNGTCTLRTVAGNTFSGGIIVTNKGRLTNTASGSPYRLCEGPITIHSGWSLSTWPATGPVFDHTGNTITNAINLYGGLIGSMYGSPTVYNGPIYLDNNISNCFGIDFEMQVNGIVSGPGGFLVARSWFNMRSFVNITNNANTFRGPVLIAAAGVKTPRFNSVNSGQPSALGSPDTVANGTIHLGYIGVVWPTACYLTFTGTNEITDRVINLPGKTLGVSLNHDGPAGNLLKFTSDFTVPGVAASDCRKTLTLSVTQATSTMEIAGSIPDATLGTVGQTNTTVLKTGAGTVILSGSNTYSGSTTISVGTLIIGNSLALRNSTLVYSNVSPVTVSFGAGITNFTLGGLTGTDNLVLTNAAGNAINLSVGNNSGINSTYDGVLSGPGSLMKVGSSTFTLSNTNSYTGCTAVSNGTLIVPHDKALGANAVYLSSNAILNLNFVGTVTNYMLTVDGVAQPTGIYGSNKVSQITGPGVMVTLWPPPPGMVITIR